MELTLIYLSLLIITATASYIYYKTIRRAQIEYESSRDILKNITLDFYYKLQKVSKDVSRVASEIEDIKKNSYSVGVMNEENKKIILEVIKRIDDYSNKIVEIGQEVNILKTEYEKFQRKDLQSSENINLNILEVDDVLKNLTETELEVLSIIEEKGEASVSEIRSRINKTREHTARLLKKLYDKGYIDRNSTRMPYRYYVRKELKDKFKNKQKIKASI